MNGRTTTTKFSSMWGDKMPIFEYVYGIIDSKINYIEHKSRSIWEKFKSSTSFGSHQTDSTEAMPSMTDLTVDKVESEQLFEQFEQLSQSIYLLGQLKLSLTEDNAVDIMNLLNDDNYLKVSEGQISEILGMKPAA